MEKSFQSRSVVKDGDDKTEMRRLPVWQIILLIWCIGAIAFFAIRLAKTV
jgi:predicted membrane protein